MESESLGVYDGMVADLEMLTQEAAVLGGKFKRIHQYNVTLKQLNTSFDQVQSRLVRIAAVRPGASKTDSSRKAEP